MLFFHFARRYFMFLEKVQKPVVSKLIWYMFPSVLHVQKSNEILPKFRVEDLTNYCSIQIRVWKKWSKEAVNSLIQLPQVSHMFWQVYDKIGDIDVHMETTSGTPDTSLVAVTLATNKRKIQSEVGKIASTPTYSQYEWWKTVVQDIKWKLIWIQMTSSRRFWKFCFNPEKFKK